MPQSHGMKSHADLVQAELTKSFGEQDLSSRARKQMRKSMIYIYFIFSGLWASGEYGPPFAWQRQLLDTFHWSIVCVSHVYTAEKPTEPKNPLDWTNTRMCGPAFLDLGMCPPSPHDYTTAQLAMSGLHVDVL